MASSFASVAVENKEHHHSAPRTVRRTWSSSSNDSTHGSKACVCAPPTHAGSFKCRLHRVNSQGHSTTRSAPQPAVSSSSSRTVEAQ